MTSPKTIHYDLVLPDPPFQSRLTDLIIDLDHLRKKQLSGTTMPQVFFQLKSIFHMLESIGSARIEGNNTTVAAYLESKIDISESLPPGIKEIQNIEKAMGFIDQIVMDVPINRIFISELHKMLVDGLEPPPEGEGDRRPGEYRCENLTIKNSEHLPPDWTRVDEYMEELFHFISAKDHAKYDLLKAAIAHHRFVWVHPFGNGNGRTVRLMTYAMLVKAGFRIMDGRIVNPTAIFCSNRSEYYKMLAGADKGEEAGIFRWCEYVLKGLKDEIEKIDRLLNHDYLRKEILIPAMNYSLDRKFITEIEATILRKAIDLKILQAKDLRDLFPEKLPQEVSRQIRKLIEKGMIAPISEGRRKYHLSFENNFLFRAIMKMLHDKGFVSIGGPADIT